MMGRSPAPPLPQRRFGETNSIEASASSSGVDNRAHSSRDPETIGKNAREAWLEMRAQRPLADPEMIKRRAVSNWLEEHHPEKKK